MFLGNAQLFLGANHGKGIHPANFGAFQCGQGLPIRMSVIKGGPFVGISHLDRFR